MNNNKKLIYWKNPKINSEKYVLKFSQILLDTYLLIFAKGTL